MKKVVFAVLLGLIFCAVPSLYAQSINNQESEYYYLSIPIEKIYLYKQGYIVLYQKGFDLARTYIPLEWFTDPIGKADLIYLGTGSAWPHLSVFYKNGEFSHIRLYVRRAISHQTWGIVPFHVDIDSYFANIVEVVFDS